MAALVWKDEVMRVDIQTDPPIGGLPEDMVGNVYQVRGGRGAKYGHMHVIVAHHEHDPCSCSGPGFTTLTVNRDGEIVGGNAYAQHYFRDKLPIARCDGIEDIQLTVRSL